MGFWSALIPTRWKLYVLLIVAFGLGFLGIRSAWLSAREADLRARLKAATKEINELHRAEEIENEVEILDADDLRRRAGKWVRAKPARNRRDK